jgi:hypothetical protein
MRACPRRQRAILLKFWVAIVDKHRRIQLCDPAIAPQTTVRHPLEIGIDQPEQLFVSDRIR